ncbi:MAG: YihY/virulence factor BrkB family protein [Actinobacteria bacterium]|nr:MAG: YihY/virulence factor BrkB family protein [Actinomycetota bacterium]
MRVRARPLSTAQDDRPHGKRDGTCSVNPRKQRASVVRFAPGRGGYPFEHGGAGVKGLKNVLRRVDAFQRRHSPLAFMFAVFKKFGEDEAGSKAALIAYYGFFSLFPLLLVFTTVLGFVLNGHTALQDKIVHSTLAQFPIIGDQIASNVHSLQGSGVALAIGIVGTLWAGMGVTQAGENAMNAVWNVPARKLPNAIFSRVRGLLFLVVFGLGVLATTVLAGLGTSGSGIPIKIGAITAAAVINLAMFLVSFRVLTAEELSWRDVLPGAIVATVLWEILQAIGGWYVARSLKGASQVYGFFAIVIGLLGWLYLGAQMTLLAAEINVVLRRKLWPRALVQPPLTLKDKEALRRLALMEERRPEEEIVVRFKES